MTDKLIVRAGALHVFQPDLKAPWRRRPALPSAGFSPTGRELIHVRWSGEAMWIPLGDEDFGIGYENHTSFPAPGQMIVYPGGISETEMLLGYGAVHFKSKMGQLAGNHFLTITSNLEDLPKLGKMVLWEGAQPIEIGNAP